LANSKVKSVTYKGVERRASPRKRVKRTNTIPSQLHGI
jgi:hypothetical protein